MKNGYEPDITEFMHARIMEKFHEFRDKITIHSSVSIDGIQLSEIIASAKVYTQNEYPTIYRPTQSTDKDQEAIETLKNFNIKPSYQYVKIFKYLRYHKGAMANDIFTELRKEIHSLSKTTVYDALKSFRSAGLMDTNPTKG